MFAAANQLQSEVLLSLDRNNYSHLYWPDVYAIFKTQADQGSAPAQFVLENLKLARVDYGQRDATVAKKYVYNLLPMENDEQLLLLDKAARN